MAKYESEDYVRVEVVDDHTSESEWLWVRVDRCDDAKRVLFGTLDNVPTVNPDLKLGQQLAISYDNTREHRKPSEF